MNTRSKVVLYQPPTKPWGMPNMSPFCIKLECYLRMAGIPYESRAASPSNAPKGKIPYVEIGGERMGDSQLIIRRFERESAAPLDTWLSAEQRALGHAVQRMVDEASFFVTVYLRWVDDAGFKTLLPEFKKMMPGPLKLAVPLVRRHVRKLLHLQGTGRHTPDEIQQIGKADWTSIATLLGDKPFLLGERPSSFDASVFGGLEALLGFPHESEVKRHASAQGNLVTYRERIRARFWA